MKVNIIIPVFNNTKEEIRNVLLSLEDQCFKDFTVTMVFDGDKENFEHVQKNYYKDGKCTLPFPLFIELLSENVGACKARNYGATISNNALCPNTGNFLGGKILFFIDADCEIRSGMLRECVKQLDNNSNVDFVYGNYWYGDNNIIHQAIEFDSHCLKTMNYISTMSPIRKSAFQAVGGFRDDLEFFQDWDLFYRMAEKGSKGKYVNEIIFKTKTPTVKNISGNEKSLDEKSRHFRKINNIEDKKLVTTTFSAPYQALHRAKMLDSDYINPDAIHRLDFKNWKATYMVGFFTSPIQPAFINHFNSMKGKKIIHFIGTDVFQLLTEHPLYVLDEIVSRLENDNATIFANSPRLVYELERIGFKEPKLLYSPIYDIDQYNNERKLPEQFTIAVYHTDGSPLTMLNDKTGNSNVPHIMEVAKALPHIKFKFFGGTEKYNHTNLDKKIAKNIEFCGRIKEENMLDFIGSCSAIIRSTVHDGFPHSPIQFMLCGRQAIVSCPDESMKYATKLQYEDIINIDDAKKDMIDCIREAMQNQNEFYKKSDEVKEYYKKLMSEETFKNEIYKAVNDENTKKN
jgi:glycosyltransferase involved in cell wall biosynthesis